MTRSDKDLLAATRDFVPESIGRSWWEVASTFAAWGFASYLAATLDAWWLRAALAVVAGLIIVRVFILYHDYLHGALLPGSGAFKALMTLFGWFVLAPTRVWRQTHNYHHAHTGQMVGSHIGSFPIVSVEMWRALSPAQRLKYRLVRHPLNVALGYLTIFAFGMCVSSFLRDPRKHWDSAVSLAFHGAVVAGLWAGLGADVAFFTVLLPMLVACASGSYLFYAQHTFDDLHIQPRAEWTYVRAALESSSYMRTGELMAWFTGNIGYHHVHHLNPTIPFYRLPEAMDAIPELQSPKVTTLSPRDIARNFSLNLWDGSQQRMVPYARP